jgi:TRAP-type C4-dicarboxylate transport system permease small subunit
MSEISNVVSNPETENRIAENKFKNMNALERFNYRVSQFFAVISGSAVILMMLLIVINASKRTFSSPILGTTEMVGWLAAISISFALGYTQIHRGHVDIDLLVIKFPESLQKLLRIVVSFLSLAFFAIVGWQLLQYAMTLSANNNISQTLGVIFYPFVILSSIGFMVFVLVLLNDFITELKGGSK